MYRSSIAPPKILKRNPNLALALLESDRMGFSLDAITQEKLDNQRGRFARFRSALGISGPGSGTR